MTNNKGFVVYGTSNRADFERYVNLYDSVHASIVSLDFDSNTYTFDDYCYEFPNARFVYWTSIAYSPANNAIMIKCTHYELKQKLHVFKLNFSPLSLKFEFSVEVLMNHRWYNMIDGKVVFAHYRATVNASAMVKNFMFIDENRSLVEIENTGACLEHPLFCNYYRVRNLGRGNLSLNKKLDPKRLDPKKLDPREFWFNDCLKN